MTLQESLSVSCRKIIGLTTQSSTVSEFSLTAAAGEVVGFQLLLRGDEDEKVSVKVQLDEPEPRIDLHQAVYVPANGRLIPDPLLPMPDSISLKPDTDHCVVADIYIPFDASPGLRQGKITVSDGRVVPLVIKVLPFALPRQATFFCEMNGYGLAGSRRGLLCPAANRVRSSSSLQYPALLAPYRSPGSEEE